MPSSKTVHAWFVKASRDIRAASALLDQEPPLLEESAFHSQQCIEKSIKGYLTHRRIRVQKTHDLVDLRKELIGLDESLAKLISSIEAKEFTKFAVYYRYPDSRQEDLRDEIAKVALVKATEVYQSLLDLVSEEEFEKEK